jgi:ribosomal protein S18 acetylase RimI-like enzyme
MGVSLHLAALVELPRLAALIRDHPLFARYHLTPDLLTRSLQRGLAAGEGIIAARQGGEPLGFAWWQPTGAFGRSPYLRLLVVAASATGAGIGSQLLAAVEATAFAGADDLFLLVTRENRDAQRLYRRRGFTAVGILEDYVQPGICEVLMRKRRGPDRTAPFTGG